MQRGSVEAECFTLGAHRPQRSEGAEAAHSGLPLEHYASVAEGGARVIHTATARELIATQVRAAAISDRGTRQNHGQKHKVSRPDEAQRGSVAVKC